MTDETVAYMGWGISAQEQIDGFRREVRELKTDNAKLKADAERMFQANVEKNNEVLNLLEDNSKLRELVRILYYCGLPWKDCDKCAMNGAEMHVKISEVEFCDGMYDRMRELGVEVDG